MLRALNEASGSVDTENGRSCFPIHPSQVSIESVELSLCSRLVRLELGKFLLNAWSLR